MNTSRRLPGGAPIWNEGKRRMMATPAVVAATFLRKSLRFGMSLLRKSDVQERAPQANTQGWDEVNQFDSQEPIVMEKRSSRAPQRRRFLVPPARKTRPPLH